MPNVKNHPLFNTQKELQDFYNLEKFIKKTHETTFSFINPNYNSNLEVNNKLNLFCDASTIDVNLDNNFINKPNSIIAGIFKSKNQDFFCYKKHIICYDNNIAELLAIYEGLQVDKLTKHKKTLLKCS